MWIKSVYGPGALDLIVLYTTVKLVHVAVVKFYRHVAIGILHQFDIFNFHFNRPWVFGWYTSLKPIQIPDLVFHALIIQPSISLVKRKGPEGPFLTKLVIGLAKAQWFGGLDQCKLSRSWSHAHNYKVVVSGCFGLAITLPSELSFVLSFCTSIPIHPLKHSHPIAPMYLDYT